MPFYSDSGLGVSNQFGVRSTGAVIGNEPSAGVEQEVEVFINGEGLNAAGNAYTFYPKVYIPAGSTILNVYVDTNTVFSITGTTPTILVGTKGTEVTNGFVISETQAETAGRYAPTLVGTWAAKLAATTQIGIAFGGTTPVVATAGQIRVIIKYARALP